MELEREVNFRRKTYIAAQNGIWRVIFNANVRLLSMIQRERSGHPHHHWPACIPGQVGLDADARAASGRLSGLSSDQEVIRTVTSSGDGLAGPSGVTGVSQDATASGHADFTFGVAEWCLHQAWPLRPEKHGDEHAR